MRRFYARPPLFKAVLRVAVQSHLARKRESAAPEQLSCNPILATCCEAGVCPKQARPWRGGAGEGASASVASSS